MTPRGGLCGCVLDGKIYLIGGNTFSRGVFDTVEVFDPDPAAPSPWSLRQGLIHPRAGHGCVPQNGRIIVMGGRGAGLLPVEVFDPERGSSVMAGAPPNLKSLWSGAHAGKVYVFVGEGESGTTSAVFEYDSAQATWTPKESRPLPRALFSAAYVGDAFFLFGGEAADRTPSGVVEKYRPVFDDPSPTP